MMKILIKKGISKKPRANIMHIVKDWRVPWGLSKIRIGHCHCRGSGFGCDMIFMTRSGTSKCPGNNNNKKKKVEDRAIPQYQNIRLAILTLIFSILPDVLATTRGPKQGGRAHKNLHMQQVRP